MGSEDKIYTISFSTHMKYLGVQNHHIVEIRVSNFNQNNTCVSWVTFSLAKTR